MREQPFPTAASVHDRRAAGWIAFNGGNARVVKDVEAAQLRAGAAGIHKIKHVSPFD